MPYAVQLGIGFKVPFDDALKSLGLVADLDKCELLPATRLSTIDADLRVMHRSLVDKLPDVKFLGAHDRLSGYLCVEWRGQLRELSPLSLELIYDPHEIGHAPEDAQVVVHATSRYFPTLIDVSEKHGGFTSLAKWQRDMMDRLHDELTASFPVFATADWLVSDIWY
ncbi:MAG: hypothetical protein JSS66_05825 [Armatimonadetes bacterium]|nr:hypothetical protein [Armatimonadota bacterium]